MKPLPSLIYRVHALSHNHMQQEHYVCNILLHGEGRRPTRNGVPSLSNTMLCFEVFLLGMLRLAVEIYGLKFKAWDT